MGLDAVELLMAFEEEFDLTIPDADAEKLCTPNQVVDYLVPRLKDRGKITPPPNPCLSQQSFYRLRNVLISELGIDRRRIRPGTPIRELLGKQTREQWARLRWSGHSVGLPSLQCTPPITWLTRSVFPTLLVLLLLADVHPLQAFILALMSWGMATAIVSDRLADQIPQQITTIGSMVPYISPPNRQSWSREQILNQVMLITSEQLTIPLGKIRPNHHFVQDLGMD